MANGVRVFVCGDVMTGRGIDQILPKPGDGRLYEPYMTDACEYVELAEAVNGPIERPVSYDYPWGDALEQMHSGADLRIINLETAITKSNDFWPMKEVLYRMNPENIECIRAAGVDCCTIANNHVLDWGYEGLEETLVSLERAGIKYAGAGRNFEEAQRPAVLEAAGERVMVFAAGSVTSGVPEEWAANNIRGGVNVLAEISSESAGEILAKMQKYRTGEEYAIVSIHWGSNWGYYITNSERAFAHELIDSGVDVVWGHSSHHIKGVEMYRGKPIIYGAGDFINDYEGIGGNEEFRGDLSLMYFVRLEKGGSAELRMVPMQTKRFRLGRAGKDDAMWILDLLNKEGKELGARFKLNEDASISEQGVKMQIRF